MTDLAALVRFAHTASLVLLAGSFVFLVFVARPAFRPATAQSGSFDDYLLACHGLISRWSLCVALVTALLGLWIQAITIGGISPEGAADDGNASTGSVAVALITQTLYGNVWLARFALAVILAVFLARNPIRPGNEGNRPVIGLALSAMLLGSMALAGHAAAGEGAEFIFQSIADILHLLAAGAWLGGLLPLVLLLRKCSVTIEVAAGVEIIRQITRRFSLLGMVCVSTIMVTGSINAWVLVGGVPQLVGTSYGQLLLLKLSLLLPMLGVAAVNLMKINPLIADERSGSTGIMSSLSLKLARNALIEAGLGFMILAIVGYLGSTPPARHAQVDWPFAFRWDWSVLESAPKSRAAVEIGFAWVVLGLFVLQFAFLSRRFRLWTSLAGTAIVVYASYVVLVPVTTDAYPTTYRRTAVTYQAISVANGRGLYAANCAACHGNQGYGDGPAAEGLRPRPADLAGRHANAHTVGDLFWWLSHGVPNTAMVGFAGRLAEDERWDLINLVRALAGAKKARSLAPIIEERPWLVAPDFVYTTTDGLTRTLKDHRGARVVLVVLMAKESSARHAVLAEAALRLNKAGIEIIVIPPDARHAQGMERGALPWVTEGNSEIHQTYDLFAGSFSEESPSAGARHVEYLIDRQGYIRARWLPAEGDAWRDPAAMAKQAALLLAEPLNAPTPAEHIH